MINLEHLILREIDCYGQCHLGFFTERQISYVLLMSKSGLIDIVPDASPTDSGQERDLNGTWCRLTTEGEELLYYLNKKMLDSILPHEDGESAAADHT